jgi:hypothetical protein
MKIHKRLIRDHEVRHFGMDSRFGGVGGFSRSFSGFPGNINPDKPYTCYQDLKESDTNEPTGKIGDSLLYLYLFLICLTPILGFLGGLLFLARRFFSGSLLFILAFCPWVSGFGGLWFNDWSAFWRFYACRLFGAFAYPA